MLHPLDHLTPESLRRLHRECVSGPAAVRRVLERLRRERTPLGSGINRRNDARSATIERVDADRVQLRLRGFEEREASQLLLGFELEGTRYFFAASARARSGPDLLEIALPGAIFQSERRDLWRVAAAAEPHGPDRVELRAEGGGRWIARVLDRSLHGLGVEVPAEDASAVPERLRARWLDGERSGEELHARVRHRVASAAPGWTRLGLSLSRVAAGEPLPVERRVRILEQSPAARARDQARLVRAAVRAARARAARRLGLGAEHPVQVPIVEYANQRGERIRAILDVVGDPRGAPAIVIPPAWGRTKETALPLAETLLATFRRAGEPLVVVRFDGTHRRGESYLDPECRAPGDEYLHFTFSQAARDIQATLDHLEADPELRPATSILVTLSLASVEGRRAMAEEAERLGGWVAAVGVIDLQSALRTISGGIDYGYGLLQGVRFGRHELVGVVADMDHTGLDAIEHDLGFLEDARRDLAGIHAPITWIHGRHDAWMDLDRVRDALACGDARRRRLIEVPTGHQLRTSREALETFMLIAEEVSEMALGRRLPGALPDLRVLERRRSAERARLPRPSVDLRAFWTDYLLGRDRRVGMELIGATAAYRNFMEAQIRRLALAPGARVADLGSGTGELPVLLAPRAGLPEGLRIDAVDYVGAALARGRDRLAALPSGRRLRVERVVADLDASAGRAIALRSGAYDAVLASLLVGYLGDPEAFVREAARLLRPGGRLVLSNLRRDADISQLFVDGLAEFSGSEARARFGSDAAGDFDGLARSFLNDAARLLELEEQGRFRFFDPGELRDLVARAGFVEVATELAFGDPPQAVVLAARRP